MNKKGHWDIGELGNWVKLLLFFLLFQSPNVLRSEELQVDSAEAIASTGDLVSTITDTTSIQIQEEPETKESYYNRGLSLYNSQIYPKAVLIFDTCLVIDSTFNEARLMRGMSLEKQGDWENAMADYEYLVSHNTYCDLLERRIKIYRISVILSKNWYYMVAMMILVILLMAVGVKTVSYKKL